MLDKTYYINEITRLTPTDCASWQTWCLTKT